MAVGFAAIPGIIRDACFAAMSLNLRTALLPRTLATVAWTLLFAVSIPFASTLPALSDALDGVPLDTRAQLAAAASAFPPGEAPALDPASPTFAPNSAASYLETNEDGNYAASTFRDRLQIYFTVLRFADDKAAAAAMEAWKATGDAVVPLDWGGKFPAFRRGQGLLGVAMLGAGVVARGQSGRWHFEVSASPQDSTPGEDASGEISAAIAAMQTLAANAVRYKLFPRELTVEYETAGDVRRLMPGDSFHVPLGAGRETRATFTLQVLDDGTPVESVRYSLELSGALAALAELDRDGVRTQRPVAEAESPDGRPVDLTFVFPAATSPELSRLIDEGDLSISYSVEARTAPTVLP